jgi:hypothetical protein
MISFNGTQKGILQLNKLDYRTIQIGLSSSIVPRYINEWIINVEDIAPFCKSTYQLITHSKIDEAKDMLPKEIAHPLSSDLFKK